MPQKTFSFVYSRNTLGCVDDSVVLFICGNSGYGYSYQPLVDVFDGLLSVWDTS